MLQIDARWLRAARCCRVVLALNALADFCFFALPPESTLLANHSYGMFFNQIRGIAEPYPVVGISADQDLAILALRAAFGNMALALGVMRLSAAVLPETGTCAVAAASYALEAAVFTRGYLKGYLGCK